MKLVAERDALAKGLARVQGVLHRKPTLPILSNVLLEAQPEGGLRIAATDLDVTFDSLIEARVEHPGRMTVDGRRLYEICRNLPGHEATVTVDDSDELVVTAKSSEFRLKGQAAEGYPQLPSAEGLEALPIDGAAFLELIERTLFSISSDDSRPNLNGVFFECVGESRVRMVSTDGHRLSQGERVVGAGLEIPAHDGVIIPRKGVQELRRVLDEAEGPFHFGFLKSNFVLASSSVKLFVRLIEAGFPDYQQVVPKSSERLAVLDRLGFLAALKRIKILASERTNGVRVELSEHQMTLISDNPDLGRAREVLEVEAYEGGDQSIAFNANYVIDILSALSAPKVELAINEALSPGLFREHGNDDYLFVVMPMRL